jgi:hypothetical protein
MSPPLGPIVDQRTPAHTITHHFFKIHSNIISTYAPVSPKRSVQFSFLTKILCAFLTSHMRATQPAHPIPTVSIILTFSEEFELWHSSLHLFILPPVTYYLSPQRPVPKRPSGWEESKPRVPAKLSSHPVTQVTHCLLWQLRKQCHAQSSDLSTSAREEVDLNLAQTRTRNLVFIFRWTPWSPEFMQITSVFIKFVRTSQETHCFSVTKVNRLTASREAYSENHIKHVNAQCGQKASLRALRLEK